MQKCNDSFRPAAYPGAINDMLDGRTPLAVLTYGAHLYGTADADSDIDIRVIFAPRADEILLGDIDTHIDNKLKSRILGPGDLDIECWSLKRFMRHLEQGDMTAIEFLNAAAHPRFTMYRHDAFDAITAEAGSYIRAPKTEPLIRARGKLGKISPDGLGKQTRFPSRADIAHTARILQQWIDIHDTGRISFPRPDAPKIRAIKSGRIDQADCDRYLADLFERAASASASKGGLPSHVDPAISRMRLLQFHRLVIDGIL